jgi:hypothetical protein
MSGSLTEKGRTMIHYDCPHCGHTLAIPEEFAGKKGRCNKCSAEIAVPRTMDEMVPTFESATPTRRIPKPLLYGAGAVAGALVLMLAFFGGLSLIVDDLSTEMSEIVDEVGTEFQENPHKGLRGEIEELSLKGDQASMQIRLEELENQLEASKDADFKTAAQLAVTALEEDLANLNDELEAERLAKEVEETQRLVTLVRGVPDIPSWQDKLAVKLGHGDASNQIDETGEHADRIHALLNGARRIFQDDEDATLEQAIKTIKAASKYWPDINNEESINLLLLAIATKLEEVQAHLENPTVDENGNPIKLKKNTLQTISQEVFAYLEYEYIRPQMEARARKHANRAAAVAQIRANKQRYEGIGASINAEKAAALQNRGAMSDAMMGIMLQNEANRQGAQQRILNR